MQEVRRRRWQGLFGKYVLSFVGLTLLLLVVNGGLETWFVYRETTQLLAKNLSEKAEATARRIEEFVSEIERQISWATRASATTIEQRHADYALLLQQVPALDRVIQLDAAGKEQLRLTRSGVVVASGIDYSGDPRFTQAQGRSVWLSPVYFDGPDPALTIAMRHSGRGCGLDRGRDQSQVPVEFHRCSNRSASDNDAYRGGIVRAAARAFQLHPSPGRRSSAIFRRSPPWSRRRSRSCSVTIPRRERY